jgi:hypothetical protein
MAKKTNTELKKNATPDLTGFAPVRQHHDGWWLFQENPVIIGKVVGYSTMNGLDGPVNFFQIQLEEETTGITKDGQFSAEPGKVLAVRESTALSDLRLFVKTGISIAVLYEGKKKQKNNPSRSYHAFSVHSKGGAQGRETPATPFNPQLNANQQSEEAQDDNIPF